VNKILFIKNIPAAKIPTKSYQNDAGWDLYSVETKYLNRGFITEIDTGINIAFPKEFYGIIFTRSSMGIEGIQLHNGVIDSGYRGKLSVFAYNHAEDIQIHAGDKIAQLLIFKNYPIQFCQVSYLPESERGTKGFGSSGK